MLIGVLVLLAVIGGIVVTIVLLTQGDDDKGGTAGPSDSTTTRTRTSASSTCCTSTTPTTPGTTATTPITRPVTTGPPGRDTVLARLKANDCIDTVVATTIVRDVILPVPCAGTNAHWKVIDVFPTSDQAVCDQLPRDRGYVGHLKEIGTAGRIACLGFTRNTTLQDLKDLAGPSVASLTQDEFDRLKQSYKDSGVKIE